MEGKSGVVTIENHLYLPDGTSNFVFFCEDWRETVNESGEKTVSAFVAGVEVGAAFMSKVVGITYCPREAVNPASVITFIE